MSLLGLVDIIGRIFNIITLAAGAVFTILVLVAGYKFATSQGDPKAIAGAKQSITYAVIGLAVVIGIFFIQMAVVLVLGFDSDLGVMASEGGGIFRLIREGVCDILTFAAICDPGCAEFVSGGAGDRYNIICNITM